jgi:Concanavalin A-like lectin/glucanases superfamily/Fibronectin type III domain
VNQTSCYLNYGYQGGGSSPMNEREFDYDSGGHGVISGNFGSLDTGWTTAPTAGTWHYVAVTYDGTTLLAYLDGSLDVTHVIGVPIATVQTLMQVGSAIGGTGVNGGNDPFHGYIACARVESGVLTASDVAANYAMGPLGTAVAITPAGLAAMAGDGQVTLTWSSSGNATNYNVKRSTTSNETYTIVTTNLTALSFTNTGLVDGTTYYFVVSATNVAGESANSAPVSAQPVSTTSPQINFGVSSGQIQFSWPQDHLGWELQTQTNSLASGLGTNWVAWPGSAATNQISFPFNPSQSSVFFRLVYP